MKDDTQMLRQVHPSFIQGGRVSSQAFRPTPKDDKQLSAYDGDLITAQNAFDHYTKTLKLPSTGVLAVTVEECSTLELPTRSDPLDDFSEHAVIDFSNFEKGPIEKKAKILRKRAEDRNWLFQHTGS